MSDSEMVGGDGGPAFPFTRTEPDGRHDVMCLGMSLRDYFAAQALIGDMARDGSALYEEAGRKVLAERAYQIADAMLEQRKRP